jgi:LacI family transcriptional regulator
VHFGVDMPTKRRAVTIQDVAKAAGVSISTVSRVLNGKIDVARSTQDRILAVIKEPDRAYGSRHWLPIFY